MAITRAQQAKQMLQKGGRIGLKGGADASQFGKSEQKTPNVSAGGASFNDLGPAPSKEVRDRQKENYEKQFFDKGQVPPLGSRPTNLKTKLDQRNKQKRLDYINNLIKSRQDKIRKGLIKYQTKKGQIQGLTDFDTLQDYIDKVQSVDDLVTSGFYSKDGRFADGDIPDFQTMDLPGLTGAILNKFQGPVTSDRLNELMEEIDTLKGLQTTSGLEGTNFNELMKTYEPNRFKLLNPEPGGDGPQDPCKGPNPPAYCFVGIRSVEPEVEPEVEEPFQLSRRFRAEGGIMNNDVVGGEFDFESARQMYGLGKLVKKVTKTVKKIAKSPIGKAALLYAGTAGLGALGAGATRAGTGFGIFSPGNVLANLGKTKALFTNKIFGDVVGPNKASKSLFDLVGGKVGAGIIGASALAGLMTPEQEEEAQDLARGEGIDIEEARRSILNAGTSQDFRARRFRAEGGSMKEPVAKKTMPLLDMGGKEMDLRAEGGFVPIGRMEKADDVPARLSKNEFVFTADAVRNAGDGDVDKGAEVMYNMMKNLESGGDVSEESQGLEGARKMFQTSQRLEEVL